jgi:hypothetical protein
MDTALNQAIDQANQTNYVTEWILIAVFLIAPAMMLLIALPVMIIRQRSLKCPRCSHWRKNKVAVQTVKTVEGNKATMTTQQVIICRKCKHEFVR